MPGKTPAEAFDRYAKPLKAVFACITRETLLKRTIPESQDANGFPLQEFFFVNNPVPLKNSGLGFNFSQYFRISWSDALSAYKVRTIAYSYEIEDGDTGHELFAFHWEPDSPNSKIAMPHMHIGFALRDDKLRVDNKAHIPSGRVPVEDVVTFLISDLGISPLNANWEKIVAATRQPFMRYKSW